MEIVLAGARRTPIGRFGGSLASLSAPELGAAAARSALEAAGVPAEAVDEVIFGNARQAGVGPNPARQVGRRAGLADRVPARTVNQACASGLRAILDAAASVRLGDAGVVLAGGTESMSNTPFLLPSVRWGQRFGDGSLDDGMYRDGFHCPLADQLMGETAETLADQYGLSRDECDRYAAASQNRAEAARSTGRFDGEIAPVRIETRRGVAEVGTDEHPRDGVTPESLAKLRPVFRKDGVVHAGNSSGITDGAAAVIVLSADRAAELGVGPMARLVGYATAGVDPRVMGIGPVPAVRDLLARTGESLDNVALVETERGVRSPGPRLRPGSGPRSRAAERERRRHRPRPSHRRHRGADRRHAAARDGAPRRALRDRDALRQRGNGCSGVVGEVGAPVFRPASRP